MKNSHLVDFPIYSAGQKRPVIEKKKKKKKKQEHLSTEVCSSQWKFPKHPGVVSLMLVAPLSTAASQTAAQSEQSCVCAIPVPNNILKFKS